MAQKEDRRIGTIIGGKWRIDSLLGTGSMAAVYAVTHRNGVKAALKILHPTLCTDPKVCERFLGEGYVTNSVKHPGIVRVLDDGMTDDGCVFLVMDLLEGTTLETLRHDRGGRLDVPLALDIADALMDALQAVHAAGIIHRDLKLQNVFVCENGDVKLLDFGVARVLETTKSRTNKSLFGMVLGTPSFMSPEQAVGARDEVDHRADIWSLGATLFTALTGETVHLGPHVQAKLLAAGTVQARSISLVAQDLPAPIAAVIDTALRFEKADRWQSVEAFRRALKEARRAAGLGEAPPVSIRPSSASLPPSKRSTKRPSMPIPVAKPTRTFAGIGPDPGFPVPEAKRTLPYVKEEATATHSESSLPEHPEGHTGAAAALPVAIRRASDEVDESDLDDDDSKAEGSYYPAVGGTVRFDDTGALLSQLKPKRSGGGLWLGTIVLVAAAIGGVAFFAMGGGSSGASDTANAAAAPATLTSAAAPIPAPAPIVIGDPIETQDAGASAAAPVAHPPVRQASAITPPPTWHPRSFARNQPSNPPTPSRPPVTPEPLPANNPAPSAPAPTASDPFATPD